MFDTHAAISQMLLRSIEVNFDLEVVVNVLVIGSAPDAIQGDWDIKIFDQVVAINNAWRATTHSE